MRGQFNPGLLGTVTSSYDAAATALFAQMTVQPSTTQKDKINALIVGLKNTAHSAGGGATLWSKMDRFHRFDLHDRQASRLDWKTPTVAVVERGGTVTSGASDQIGWTAGQGFNLITPAVGNYLDWGIHLASGPNFTQDSGAIGWRWKAAVFGDFTALFEDSTNGTGTTMNAIFAMKGGANSRYVVSLSDGDAGAGVNGPIDTNMANWQANWCISRTSAADKITYRGNVAHFNQTGSSASRAPGSLKLRLLFGDNVNGYGSPASGNVLGGFWSGAGFSAADVTALNALLNTFEAP